MTKFFLLLAFAFSSFGFLYAQKDTTFTLQGNITGFTDSTEITLINSANGQEVAKTRMIRGKFTMQGKLFEPALFYLSIPGQQQQYIYLENKLVTVTGSKENLANLTVKGSPSHLDFVAFNSVFNPMVVHMNTVAAPLQTMPEGRERDSILALLKNIVDTMHKRIDQFVEQRPKSFVVPFMLYVTYSFYEDPILLEKRFARVDPAIRNSGIGKSLTQFIDYYKVGAVGTDAIDFTQPDTSGKPVSLSSFKGKYVLVDFWASWCAPCRMENPNVVANYHKFKDKNFTVFGVSLDRPGQKDKWLQAIKQDQLTWTHVSDLQHWQNAAAQLYHVQGIPYNLLLDPNGKIIAKNLRGPELEKKLCELVGCN